MKRKRSHHGLGDTFVIQTPGTAAAPLTGLFRRCSLARRRRGLRRGAQRSGLWTLPLWWYRSNLQWQVANSPLVANNGVRGTFGLLNLQDPSLTSRRMTRPD
jgi:hypothetical protein